METQESPPPSRVRTKAQRTDVAAATRIGRRNANADALLLDEAAGLYAVSDGVGDTPRSGLVARMVLEAMRELFLPPWLPYSVAPRSLDEAKRRLWLGVTQAHGRIYAPWLPRADRAGATFAGVVDCGESLALGHIGDSRIYLLRASKGLLAPLTEDHTVAVDAHRRGTPRAAAASLRDAHALTKAIGMSSAVDLRPVVRRWEPGDIALLCTDGLSDCLDSEAITTILLDAPDLGKAADQLVDRAIEVGGSDNATVVLVRRTT